MDVILRQPDSRKQRRGDSRSSGVGRTSFVFGNARKSRQVKMERDLVFLMSEASLLEDEFRTDVLVPLLGAATAMGRNAEMKCNLKRGKRALQKTKLEYHGDCFRLLDLLRGAIICTQVRPLLSMLRTLGGSVGRCLPLLCVALFFGNQLSWSLCPLICGFIQSA